MPKQMSASNTKFLNFKIRLDHYQWLREIFSSDLKKENLNLWYDSHCVGLPHLSKLVVLHSFFSLLLKKNHMNFLKIWTATEFSSGAFRVASSLGRSRRHVISSPLVHNLTVVLNLNTQTCSTKYRFDLDGDLPSDHWDQNPLSNAHWPLPFVLLWSL